MLLNFTKTYENRTDIYQQIENLVSFDLKTVATFLDTKTVIKHKSLAIFQH